MRWLVLPLVASLGACAHPVGADLCPVQSMDAARGVAAAVIKDADPQRDADFDITDMGRYWAVHDGPHDEAVAADGERHEGQSLSFRIGKCSGEVSHYEQWSLN